ncbi:myosin-crossreactive antigen [Nakamurella sp. UYEF19]
MVIETQPQAYLVGSGIGSLAGAVFLIRDAHFAGENIHILEELPLTGGPSTDAETRFTGV